MVHPCRFATSAIQTTQLHIRFDCTSAFTGRMTSSLPQGRTMTRLQHREQQHHACSPLSFKASMSSKISSASSRANHRMQEIDAAASSCTIIRHATSSNMTLRNKTPQQDSAITTASQFPAQHNSSGGEQRAYKQQMFL
ncbi:hypothetical protein Nepgr_016439 [Nepenthes gracilis]|uniref:Uncharacterized protein n=1 Tax=Nepenthes gracilis TaxID=150966 RepID=A0AAD3SMP2_NEPGR|nr:hypothetical protein Nepgr_016439 [Nepenthes gracilis]